MAYPSNREAREWHAVEHKCALLIESSLPIDENNLKHLSALTRLCGIALGIYWLQAVITTWLLFINLFGLINLPANAVYLLVFFFGSTLVATEFPIFFNDKTSDEYYRVKIMLIIFSLPSIILPFLFERVFTLRQPSNYKIDVAVRELKTFFDEYTFIHAK